MLEADLLRTVVEMAHLFGWLVHHDRPALTEKGWRTAVQGDAGFPDLVLARDGRVLIVELKAEGRRLTAEQVAWQDALGRFADVWYPSDLDDIGSTLR